MLKLRKKVLKTYLIELIQTELRIETMKSKIFKSENGLELLVKNRKSAVILEMNPSQMDSKYKVEFKFNSRDFDELYSYIDTAANESWDIIISKEASSLGSDYYEYYDKELDSNGYLCIRENTIVINRPSLESNKLYQFNKRKMESFAYDFRKSVANKMV
ncbi:hypothetical protein [Paenibacillus sp. NAIST15-1]|uniref:hypothetical protein n=1 Tax=Paenibacillus sp. NAIST15-1 TaxID=1605994 RepID=UPI001D118B57|nr:hypothetical protein [Paenibacillus sp. NAIST15-1]